MTSASTSACRETSLGQGRRCGGAEAGTCSIDVILGFFVTRRHHSNRAPWLRALVLGGAKCWHGRGGSVSAGLGTDLERFVLASWLGTLSYWSLCRGLM